MAIFTSIAAAIGLTGFFATAFVTAASFATSLAISYVASSLSGDPKGNSPSLNKMTGVQGKLRSGADVPRSFNFGYSMTAGSLVYANTWGEIQPGGTELTPNAYLTQVIALADLPGGDLVELWVNGELCTITNTLDDMGRGYRVAEYVKEGQPYLWVKYYDGTQTTADSYLTGTVSSVDRPWGTTRVGTGVAYVIVTALINDTLFSGFPEYKFGLSGVPLYDPTKDDTNGGSGSHRWSDPSTWGGDGDNFPVVQAYNVLRGISYGGQWLYGLQRMTAARLPAANWNAQIAKCRASIAAVGGSEPTYRTGGQVSVNSRPADVLDAIMSGCQGRISEIGGFYKTHVGSPDSPSFAFTDDDILSTEGQQYLPFFGLAESINGVVATYPSPEEGWAMKPAPALYSPDYEAEDGSRRLLANPQLDFVPYPAQVQRLQKSALLEARRARRHDLTLPPVFWLVEPGDVGEWTSVRNGYVDKQFRVDAVTDRANLDVLLTMVEVDPTDYDWDHDTEFKPSVVGPTTIPRPAPQGIVDWFAEPATVNDSGGSPRRPAIRISWDGSLAGVVGIQYEVRLNSSGEHVTRGRSDQLATGALLISQGLLPDTAYEVRGQYLPSAPRDMLWSDWLDVTTPDIRLSLADFSDELTAIVSGIEQVDVTALNTAINLIASLLKNQDARNWLDKKQVRSQLDAVAGNAKANIEELRDVMVDQQTAFAAYQLTVSATFGGAFSEVSTVSAAVAQLDGYAAASWGVSIDVNGYVSGIQLVDASDSVSSFIIAADKIQFAFPGVNGDAPIPFLTTGTVNGVPAIGMTGDFYLDGQITAQAMNVGTLSAITVDAGDIRAGTLADPAEEVMLIDLNNGFIDIFDNT